MSSIEIPNYSNINVEVMAAKIGLKVKHIPILIASFTEESKEIALELKAAIDSKNYEQIQHHSHSIKGSAGNLKFDEVYEMAKAMEGASREENKDFNYIDTCDAITKAIESISF